MASKRGKLTTAFVEALERKWEQSGDQVIDEIRRDNPALLARLVADLCPREVEVAVEQASGLESVDDCLERLAELFARDPARLQIVSRRAQQIAVEHERALPQSPADRRDRERRRQQANGQWTSTG
jgi:hypothetical protein